MGKLILLLIAGLGAALYFPTSRAVVIDVAAPILDPAFSWSTNGEMERITRDLVAHERAYRTLPDQREWQSWLTEEYQGEDASTDAWGSDYTLVVWPDSFAVVSPGPDRSRGTEDDLSVVKQRPRR